jgi:two-component system, OmpR family, response regulator
MMLVDDEVDFLETLVKRLRRRNVDVVGANSGDQALVALDAKPVDVVVLDVKMPGLDGIETLRQIKKKHPQVEVIMLTGHASVEVAIRGMEIGAFDYLMKPMDIDELLYKAQDAYRKKVLEQKRTKSTVKTKEG